MNTEPNNKPNRVAVCGVDCHRGDSLCNGYCTGEQDRPPALPAAPAAPAAPPEEWGIVSLMVARIRSGAVRVQPAPLGMPAPPDDDTMGGHGPPDDDDDDEEGFRL